MKGQFDHVDQFLSQVDARGTFLRFGELMSEAARADAGIRENLSAIATWAQTQSERLPDQVASPGGRHVIEQGPAAITLAAVCYLRAQAGLQANPARVPHDIHEMQKAVAGVRKLLDALEPSFIGRLLTETDTRAARDSIFARKLSDAKEDLVWMASEIPSLPESDVSQRPQAMSASSSNSMTANQWRVFAIVVMVVVVVVSPKLPKNGN